MPFTPLHLGPALAISLPLRRYIHVPTFIIANVIVDVEPLLVLVLGLNYPLHGYLHTFLAACLAGLLLAFVTYFMDRYFSNLWGKLLLTNGHYNLRSYVIAGISGSLIHVLLDSPLYSDIRPFYPLSINPLYMPEYLTWVTMLVYDLCVCMLIIGLTYYYYLVVRVSLVTALRVLGIVYVLISVLNICSSYSVTSLLALLITPLIIGVSLITSTLVSVLHKGSAYMSNLLGIAWSTFMLVSQITFIRTGVIALELLLAISSLLIVHTINIFLIHRSK